MRRKSERNKGKASPEKKVEKPTRKSTRRRGKRSPSTSPDRDNSNDAIATSTRDGEGETTSKTRLPLRESDKTNEAAKSDVTSMEISTIKEEGAEATDAGSVWKVARADASPGEIQKLKLCRQRNLSETSDASSNRKKSNKWHEGGEGITEEIDSADERATGRSSMTTVDSAQTTDKIASVLQGRDSSEEVSDSKEFPPEIATAELSDVKPNIDDVDQGETSETTIVINANARQDDKPSDAIPEPSGSALPSSVNDNPDGDKHDEHISKEKDKDAEIQNIKTEENKDMKEEEGGNDVETKIVPKIEDTVDRCSNNEDDKVLVKKEKMAVDDNDDENCARESKESSSEDNEKKNDKVRDNTSGNRKHDTSEDNSDDDNKQDRTTKASLPRTTSRRKHRDKYRDSSNSDTGESEDESERNSKRETEEELKENRDNAERVEETNCDKDTAGTPETRPETPDFNDISANNEIKMIENNKTHFNKENERIDKIISPTAPLVQSQTNCKPPKVNLKRSFAARPSVETVEAKKDSTDNEANDLANQDKENQASSELIDARSIPKKRRWGTILASSDPTPAFSVSTDSLKVLVPGAKPLPISEVRLSKDDDEERDRRSQREKRYSTSESGVEHKSRDDGEKSMKAESKKDSKGENHIASRRKISIVKDTQQARSPSPPPAIPTSILLIKNLVRPFTLNQIRELLSRTGTIVENGFWMDRIKSKCFVEYVNEDQAFETRQALHGISWPVSNPKKLQVEYATKEDMELARELSKEQPASRKTEPLAANDGWQQDWARDERTNSSTKVTVIREWDLGKEDGQHFTKDKDREKKEIDKKRRQRSRSPTLEAHLPPPARKFKKKEDDPPPAKLLDDLFRKTKATPCIYWLPLTNEQIVVKEEMRRQHMAEHARRLEEMRRAERNRDGRRRRSPRK